MPRRSKFEEQLDFEIVFYQKLLAAYPNFVDVLIPLGDAYTRRGLYEQGLQIDLKLAKLRRNDPLTWYNLACSYSLLGRTEEGLECLRRAFDLGYADLAFLTKDPDLANVRRTPKFRQFVSSLLSQHPA